MGLHPFPFAFWDFHAWVLLLAQQRSPNNTIPRSPPYLTGILFPTLVVDTQRNILWVP